ncbi:HAD family hydrolase [Proteinivorax hydrogeniformans]|uniref:HAD family hydrolase n=1 Tax=Proteinivorax hydrogeniformans TaxID=1826727 RepID=A0AAU8HTM2_9FIRM
MNKKIVFFDIDGTLIECGQGMNRPLKSTVEAIKAIQKNGHLAVVATGRPMAFMPNFLLDLGFDGYITANGAQIQKKGQVLYSKQIEKETLTKAVDFFKKEDIDFILEGQQKAYFSTLSSEAAKRFFQTFLVPKENITENWELEHVKANKMVVVLKDETQLEKFKKVLGETFTFMKHPGESSYDVYFSDCTKADGIKIMLDHLNMDIKNTVAFGDGTNDIEMFQLVKTGIAMGNAKQTLKEEASFITEDVFSHGILEGLKKAGLL